MSNPLLHAHARTLATYRAALTTAQAQTAELQNHLADLQALLAESRQSEDLWQRQCAALDRYTRVQTLELAAAKRVARETGQELARVRVELEDLRRGVKRVRRVPPVLGVGVRDGGVQMGGQGEGDEGVDGEGDGEMGQQVVREWVEATGVLPEAVKCDCPTAKAVRGLFEERVRRRDRARAGEAPRDVPRQYVPPVPGLQTGERERRRELREKLRATREKLGERRVRAVDRDRDRDRDREFHARRGNSTFEDGGTVTFEV
ncbi:hypothetical protein BZA05DRAFT_457640 [Tricharina praecox]|uniref:uncharacterized protein n=1 Tax=Tricharina praecox TaxID=43433 RepID=UPI0022202164|nr:uncharacterized protein BZA05DRAFT_457640 [Tricharina praecox]KAI5847550.1 hypothetical protein BZA05DRAFT_457640 [Tricharina praecox]